MVRCRQCPRNLSYILGNFNFHLTVSVSFKRNVLFFLIKDMKEPVYEFDFGPRFIPKFEKYPIDQIFNW